MDGDRLVIGLEELLRVPQVDVFSGFDISPDDQKVVFSWNRTGQWEIYELPLGAPVPPHQITVGPGGKFAPVYSPDGARLAYAVDFDGSERYRLFVLALADGKPLDLAPDISHDIMPHFAWSPDGSEIAFLSNRFGCFGVYVMPSDGGAERLVLTMPHPLRTVHWSPNGCWLAVTAETHGQDWGIFLVPAEGGEARPVTDANGLLDAHHPCWAAKSDRLAFCTDARGVFDIAIYDIASREITWVTDCEGDKQWPDWSPDGEHLVYVHSLGAVAWLEVLKSGEAPIRYQVESGVHYRPRFTSDGRQVICGFDNPRYPPDLWALSLLEGKFRQLTCSLPSELDSSLLVMPVEVEYPGLDRQNIPALLYRPPNLEAPAPAVIVVHGGPNWHFQAIWYPFMAHLANRGWVVLAPNYRGSTGYGRAWQRASRFDLGGVDTRDVAAGAVYLVRQGLAHPSRIAVTGRSHGGYLTMTCLTQYPELWAAGSAVVPFINWFTAHAGSRHDLQHWDVENFGDPEKNRNLWHQRSPFFFLERVRAPVQLICAANDPRCPASESISARDRLHELGRVVDFALYPDDGHAFLKIENVVDSEMRRVMFLERFLQ